MLYCPRFLSTMPCPQLMPAMYGNRLNCANGSVTSITIDQSNTLNGSLVGKTLGLFTSLTTLFMWSSTRLTGTLPTEVGLLANLAQVDLCCNGIEGTIPSQFGTLVRLDSFALHANLLSGTIPTQLDLLRRLTFVRLFGNRLSGNAPLFQWAANRFDASYCQLQNNDSRESNCFSNCPSAICCANITRCVVATPSIKITTSLMSTVTATDVALTNAAVTQMADEHSTLVAKPGTSRIMDETLQTMVSSFLRSSQSSSGVDVMVPSSGSDRCACSWPGSWSFCAIICCHCYCRVLVCLAQASEWQIHGNPREATRLGERVRQCVFCIEVNPIWWAEERCRVVELSDFDW